MSDRVKADAVYEKIERLKGGSQDDLAGALRNTTGSRFIVWAYIGDEDNPRPIIYEAGVCFDDNSAVRVVGQVTEKGWTQKVDGFCSAPEVRQAHENRVRKYQIVDELLGSNSPLTLETNERSLADMPTAGSA